MDTPVDVEPGHCQRNEKSLLCARYPGNLGLDTRAIIQGFSKPEASGQSSQAGIGGRLLREVANAVGDDGGTVHVSHPEATVALSEARQFLAAIEALLATDILEVASDRVAGPAMGEQERT